MVRVRDAFFFFIAVVHQIFEIDLVTNAIALFKTLQAIEVFTAHGVMLIKNVHFRLRQKVVRCKHRVQVLSIETELLHGGMALILHLLRKNETIILGIALAIYNIIAGAGMTDIQIAVRGASTNLKLIVEIVQTEVIPDLVVLLFRRLFVICDFDQHVLADLHRTLSLLFVAKVFVGDRVTFAVRDFPDYIVVLFRT